VRGGSPAYSSTISAGPRRSEVNSSGYPPRQDTGHSRSQPGYRDPPRSEQPSWSNSSRSQPLSSWRNGSGGPPANQSSLPKWPPENNGSDGGEGRGGSGYGGERQGNQYSREDMMAMNRRPTPLQAKPPTSPSGDGGEDQPAPGGPIMREAFTRDQLHSLNSVPRAKFRHPNQWKEEGPPPAQPVRSQDPRGQPVRRSEGSRSQYNSPQDHWLIQEAERRRLTDGQKPAHFSGPIKPANDDLNRWRGGEGPGHRPPNMPQQIRQTLLQKTAGARGSTGSNHSGDLPPQSSSPAYSPPHSMSQTLPRDFHYGEKERYGARQPPPHRAPSPEERRENGMPVSGKQRCSHCSQELGWSFFSFFPGF
jgi:hypothetical protein